MSHFTVLVIGPNPEEQLAPYHEFECTGIDDQHVQDIDKTAEVQASINEMGLKDGLDWHGLADAQVDDENQLNKAATHKYGCAVVKDGKLVKAVRRTNPNKKWDWYVLGGRWSGMLMTKRGDKTDSARIKDIDFNGMRANAESEARERYARAQTILAGLPAPTSWEFVRDQMFPEDINKAREFYNSQPAVAAANKDRDLMLESGDLTRYFEPVEKMVFEARKKAFATFAVVKDGKWYEKGQMGWWACVSNEKDSDQWLAEYETLLANLPPETIVSVYDCHI